MVQNLLTRYNRQATIKDILIISFYKLMAEREGFEPPIELPLCRISSAVLSTTQPSLHNKSETKIGTI